MDDQEGCEYSITEMSVDRVRDFYRSDEESVYGFDGDFEPRSLRSPDTGKWEEILLSDHFANDLRLLDDLFHEQGYDVETHVDRPSFRQVEYESHPRPEPLGLMVDDYEGFSENVSHPVFHGMGRDDKIRPTGSNIDVSFGGYDDVESLDLGFRSMDVNIPTFLSFNSSVLDQTFSSLDDSYGEGLEDPGCYIVE